MDNEELYKKVRKKVHRIRRFYIHAIIYLSVNGLLFMINFLTSFGYKWFLWPLSGWGIVLLFHAVSAFGLFGLFGTDWEERKIRKIMEKERKSKKD